MEEFESLSAVWQQCPPPRTYTQSHEQITGSAAATATLFGAGLATSMHARLPAGPAVRGDARRLFCQALLLNPSYASRTGYAAWALRLRMAAKLRRVVARPRPHAPQSGWERSVCRGRATELLAAATPSSSRRGLLQHSIHCVYVWTGLHAGIGVDRHRRYHAHMRLAGRGGVTPLPKPTHSGSHAMLVQPTAGVECAVQHQNRQQQQHAELAGPLAR